MQFFLITQLRHFFQPKRITGTVFLMTYHSAEALFSTRTYYQYSFSQDVGTHQKSLSKVLLVEYTQPMFKCRVIHAYDDFIQCRGKSKCIDIVISPQKYMLWVIQSTNIYSYDRHNWRSGVRSAMHAASQLSGRGPTGVDVTAIPAR